MISETLSNPDISQLEFEIKPSTTATKIMDAMIYTITFFLKGIREIKDKHNEINFNENNYTQEYVANLDKVLRNHDIPFCVQKEYSDLHSSDVNRKRRVDFYFYPSEEESDHIQIYAVEAKRLPTLGKEREREYVIGNNLNGGIERFKFDEHGKGLTECGILAYIEENNFDFWFETINNWITDLSKSNNWNLSEKLQNLEKSNTWAKSFSITNRKLSDLNLYHLWIKII